MLQHLPSILQTQMPHNAPIEHPSSIYLTNLLLNVNDEDYEDNSYDVGSLFNRLILHRIYYLLLLIKFTKESVFQSVFSSQDNKY